MSKVFEIGKTNRLAKLRAQAVQCHSSTYILASVSQRAVTPVIAMQFV